MSENDFEERLNRIKKLSDKLSKLNKSETDDIDPEKEEINLPESEENNISIDEAEEIEDNNEQIDEVDEEEQIEEEIPPKSTKRDSLPKEKNDNTSLYVIIVILLVAVLVLISNNYDNNTNNSISANPLVEEYNNEKNDIIAKSLNEAIKESLKDIRQFRYTVNGRTYLLPESEVQGFLQLYPNAKLVDETKDTREKQTSVTSKKNENKINSTKPEPVYPIKNYITGDNPYSKYYGPGIYDFENTHSIFIQSAKEDRLFILSDGTGNILIRTTYIKANENYTIEYLKPDIYNISFISGKDWSDEFKLNNCIKGGFTKNLSIGVNNYTFYLNYPNPSIINNSWIKENFSFDSSNISNFPFPCL